VGLSDRMPALRLVMIEAGFATTRELPIGSGRDIGPSSREGKAFPVRCTPDCPRKSGTKRA
jgi:hypothetical protein